MTARVSEYSPDIVKMSRVLVEVGSLSLLTGPPMGGLGVALEGAVCAFTPLHTWTPDGGVMGRAFEGVFIASRECVSKRCMTAINDRSGLEAVNLRFQ